MKRASAPSALKATIDGRSVGLFVGDDGGLYARRNGRSLWVAFGVCAVPVGPSDRTGITYGVFWSGQPILIDHLNARPNLFWPNRYRDEPWAPDAVWLDDEGQYRKLRAWAHRPAPPRLPNLPMIWEDQPAAKRRIALQARDLEIIRHLARFGVEVSTRIAFEFFHGQDLTGCQRRLKALTDSGYIARGRPQLSRGSLPYVYRLTKAGFAEGQKHYDAEGEPYVPLNREWTGRVGGGAQSLEHDLRASGAVMELVAFARLLGCEAEPLGPFEARCDVPTAYDPSDRRHKRVTMSELGHTGMHELRLKRAFRDVVPDGGVRFTSVHARTRELLIEFDRTARPSKNASKLRGYDSFLGAWWYRCERLEGQTQPWVLFVCTSESVVGSFLDLAATELTGWRPGDGDGRDYPGRESVGFCTEAALYEDAGGADVHFVAAEGETGAMKLGSLIEQAGGARQRQSVPPTTVPPVYDIEELLIAWLAGQFSPRTTVGSGKNSAQSLDS
jgi:hypothetical protein